MKLSKTILPLLLSSALWIPAAYAADDNQSNPNASSTTGTPSNPGAVQPAPVVPPVDSSTNSNASTNAGATGSSGTDQAGTASGSTNASASTNAGTAAASNVDTSSWTGKTVKGSDGKKIGTVSAAAGDKVTVDTKFGDIELASNLVADDGSGNLSASTTSTKDTQAMAKSQKGDMKGAQAASKRHFAKKEPKAKVQPASMKSGEETTPSTEQAPAGEAPAATPQAPASQVNPKPPAKTQPQTNQSPNPSQQPQ